MKMHQDYCKYIAKNYKNTPLSKEIIRELYTADHRSAEMSIPYYKVFCTYFGYDINNKDNIEKYKEYFEKEKLSKTENTWLKLLKNNFNPVEINNPNNDISIENNILCSTYTIVKKDKENPKKQYTYFTVSRIKSYLRSRINNNNTLRQTEDFLSDILTVLMKQNYVAYKFEKDIDKDRIYYLIEDKEE